jgi:hypothetical protein
MIGSPVGEGVGPRETLGIVLLDLAQRLRTEKLTIHVRFV